MLTALTIKNETSKKWYKKIVNKLKGNSVDVQLKSARGVSLRHITYTDRKGKIDWTRLNAMIGNQRNHLLCSEQIILPSKIGFRRFQNNEFKTRLASNLAIYILSKLDDKNIKVGLYDLKGEYTEILPYLVKYSANSVVVTENSTAYEYEVNNIYEETGATVQLTSNRIHLMDCPIVIAPEQICETLPLSGDTIVLSVSPPTVCTAGLVYYNYHFRMPNQFAEIKPPELSEEYFCGALYTKAGQFELDSIVPTICSNPISTQTRASILDYLQKTKEENTQTEEKAEIST